LFLVLLTTLLMSLLGCLAAGRLRAVRPASVLSASQSGASAMM